MKYQILILLSLVAFSSCVTATDSQLTMTCGGDDELVIHCLGDEELNSLGFGIQKPSGGVIPPKGINPFILYGLGFMLLIFMFLIIILAKRRKRKA